MATPAPDRCSAVPPNQPPPRRRADWSPARLGFIPAGVNPAGALFSAISGAWMGTQGVTMRPIAILALLLVTLFAAVSAAQVPTGTVSGRIVSSDGAPLPGVTVTAKSSALQGERVAVSTANGDFIVPLLPPGDYTLT